MTMDREQKTAEFAEVSAEIYQLARKRLARRKLPSGTDQEELASFIFKIVFKRCTTGDFDPDNHRGETYKERCVRTMRQELFGVTPWRHAMNLLGQDVELSEERAGSDPAEGPDARAEREDAMHILRECVDALKPIYRDTIRLRFFEQKSWQEVADALGEKLGTVKPRKDPAFRLLAQCLALKGITAPHQLFED